MVNSVTDAWVSAEFQRLAQVINDYDHNLFLEWIPNVETIDDAKKCFRIVDDRTKTIVMYFDSVTNPVAILEKLWTIDQDKNDVVAKMDARNAAIEALENEKRIEEMEAMKDFGRFILKNTKSRWRHNGQIYDDEFRPQGSVSKVIE